MSAQDDYAHELSQDVERALEAFYESDTAYSRRIVVRLFASAVEGHTYGLKQRCLARLQKEPRLYSIDEAALLMEENYSLGKDARPHARPQFAPTAESFEFALKMFVKDTTPELDIRSDRPGWTMFTRAFTIRNRITHPKSRADLVVSDEEFACVQHSHLWFETTLMSALVESSLLLHEQAARARGEILAMGKAPSASSSSAIIPQNVLAEWKERLDAKRRGLQALR
ncbi:MAG: hypothetical protein ABL977_04395 [Candidatus Eisenbacteria bacterium]